MNAPSENPAKRIIPKSRCQNLEFSSQKFFFKKIPFKLKNVILVKIIFNFTILHVFLCLSAHPFVGHPVFLLIDNIIIVDPSIIINKLIKNLIIILLLFIFDHHP